MLSYRAVSTTAYLLKSKYVFSLLSWCKSLVTCYRVLVCHVFGVAVRAYLMELLHIHPSYTPISPLLNSRKTASEVEIQL